MSHHLQLREELELGSEVVLDTVTRTSQETEPRVRARVTRCAILWIERETAPLVPLSLILKGMEGSSVFDKLSSL